MSWFTSWFTSSKNPVPPPASQPAAEKRVLEEPVKPAEPTTVEAPKSITTQQPTQSERLSRNKLIFGAGAVFFAFSLLVTRRSLARKRLASNPAFYANAPAHQAEQAKKVNGAMEAVEALNIATINVLSLSMMATGGALWYLDINSLAEARRKLRGGLGIDGAGKSEKEAEEEFEEWMATVLARKEAKGPRPSQTNDRGQER
ncbi:uncharacterized protein Z520_04663 [Fonsecaea multimorphosa CBS 102226]|uniref:Altered inheritance of mitochondria protein 11 n=1 Tax=Fonsecaea multimorphosa CBS 102226 TaxID=1442371 RepID=A0A0D2KA40_9EURO|nr:uncharacterized protein Z520_04663 [Fonsecaea multimorphosa CBS 102226]KIY00025.1 hypothetical protein Z520_04663 [Fonsecaea multimorphosa CBS 102226]OAL26236.1 hypothetical protein AYO22_04414 [Fonsecaea multimorphosa]